VKIGLFQHPVLRCDRRQTSVKTEPRLPRAIPRSQFARIRALVKYGISVVETAAVYGVAASEIERILHHD
jgi:hypothetical protein